MPLWQRAALGAAFAAALAAVAVTAHHERYMAPYRLDDPSYHLITVATWTQHADLRMPKFHYGDRATVYYPIAGELLNWSLIAPLRHSDFLARWTQLLYLAGLLLATAAVARRLGATRATTALALLLLLTVRRLFPDLALSAANDLMAAFFFVAAVDALLAIAADRTHRAAGPSLLLGLYLGAALGLLAGTKYLGVLFAAPLAAALLLLPWLAPAGDGRSIALRRWRRHLALAALAAAVAAVAGGYTYLRNLASVGNPMFPLPIALGSWELPGWQVATLDFRRALPEFAIDPLRFLVASTDFTGKPFLVTLLPAAVAAPLACLAWRQRRSWRLDAFVLALPAILYVLFVLRVYDHREVRYVFAALAVAAAAFAWLADRLLAARPRLHGAVLAGGALLAFAFLVPGDTLGPARRALLALAVAAAGAAAGAATAWTPFRRRAPTGRLRGFAPPAIALLAAVALGLGLADTERRYTKRKYENDWVVAALAEAAPEGTVVAVVGGNRWYPVFGSRLEHRAFVVPRRGPLEEAFYTWGGGDVFPFNRGDFQQWRRNLDAAGVRYVVVHPDKHHKPVRQWLRQRQGFRRIAVAGERELWERRVPPADGGLQSGGARDAP